MTRTFDRRLRHIERWIPRPRARDPDDRQIERAIAMLSMSGRTRLYTALDRIDREEPLTAPDWEIVAWFEQLMEEGRND